MKIFLQVLESQRVIVTYEVIIGVQRLVDSSGRDLSEPSWDVLCDLLKMIADNIAYFGKFIIFKFFSPKQISITFVSYSFTYRKDKSTAKR